MLVWGVWDMKKCIKCGCAVSLEIGNIWPSYWKDSKYTCMDCARKGDAQRRGNRLEYHKNYSKAHYKANKETYGMNTKSYRESPHGRAVRNNLGRQRRMRKKKATTNWVGDSMILKVYEKAQEFGLSVDHIIPLDHKSVCGLHTWNNLQLLSKRENSSKYNNFVADW